MPTTTDLGANWRVQFADADGVPFNMLSFEEIDFGAISYKEIFQNVKTILATPLYSAQLERMLGVDQRIVDLPIQQAAQATSAILAALYFWESRAKYVDVQYSADVINAHLIVTLQLSINNVIYGTSTPYDRANIYQTFIQEVPPSMSQPVPGPPGPQGIPGTPGARGSLWFTGTTDPSGFTFPLGTTLQANDMYLNTSTGDVWTFIAAAGTGTLSWQRAGAKKEGD